MRAYVIRRLLLVIPTLLILSVIVFLHRCCSSRSPKTRWGTWGCSSFPASSWDRPGTAMAAATMRMTRTMMLEVLRQDYVRTAWSLRRAPCFELTIQRIGDETP